MTNAYAGSTVRLYGDADGYDGEPLVPADVTSVMLAVFDMEDAEVLADTAGTWNATTERWEYDWASSSTAGSYRLRVTVTDTAGRVSWRFVNFALASNPAPAPTP